MESTLTADGTRPKPCPVEHREYDYVDPSEMATDPANAAEKEGLVGVHTKESRKRVGAWRWACMNRRRDRLLPLIQGKRCADIGGYAGPIGYGAIVIDRLGELQAIWDVAGYFDSICLIHTLEHVTDAPCLLATCGWKLKPGGHIIVAVPSWRKENMHADRWSYHAWTFALSADVDAKGGAVYLDRLLMMLGFELLAGEDDGDSILMIARRPV